MFQNHLNINGLLFPEHLFEENRQQFIKITKICQENLKRRAIPPQVLQPGNIVSNFMLPASRTPGQSSEIVLVIKHIYRVEELRDMSARLINLLYG